MTITIFHKYDRLAQAAQGEFSSDIRMLEFLAQTGDLRAFDDDTGSEIDVALALNPAPRPRGRPSLGVEAREVTLLPRHWEWLATQPGGASVTLRKLVEAARLSGHGEQKRRNAAAHKFLTAIVGDFPAYEEGISALHAGDRQRFDDAASSWPKAFADHARALAWPENGA